MTTLYAGRRMTMWATPEEARESWRKDDADLLQRSETVWWRATTVEFINPPHDVDMKAVLKKDL